jgi:hypothetical protein
MPDRSELKAWDRVEMLPDGRYLLSDDERGTRVADADGTNLIQPSASEIVALKSLLKMRFDKKKYWARDFEDNDDDEEIECEAA